MRCEYRALASYEDTGRVLSHWPDKDGPDEILFKTSFIRPDKFRFEYTDHHPYPPLRHITNTQTLWSTDGVTETFWSIDPKIRRIESIESGVRALMGVSRRSSYYVPSMLLPIERKSSDPSSWQLVGTSEVNGVPCHHLRTDRDEGQYDLWIGTSDFLLRKISEDDKATDRLPRLLTEVLYESIDRNEPIPAARFSFSPPPAVEGTQPEPSQRPSALPTILDDAKAKAKLEGKAMVIEFGASWCGPCHYFQKFVAVGEEVKAAQADLVFVSMECDSEQTEAICAPYDLNGYPTFVVLDSDGSELSRRTGLGGLGTPKELVTYLHAARDAVLTEEAMLQQLQVNSPTAQLKAAEWYAQHKNEAKAAVHYALVAKLDSDNSQGLGADAAWTALDLTDAQARTSQTAEAYADFVMRFPGTEPASDALVYAALSGSLEPQKSASLLALHAKRLQNAWHLENIAYLALELDLVSEAQVIAARLAHDFPGQHVPELQAALALARGDMKAARGFYALCVAQNVLAEAGTAECELLGKSIEAGEKGPRHKALLRFARSFFVNLKSPGESGDEERKRLRYEGFLAEHAGHDHDSEIDNNPKSQAGHASEHLRAPGEAKAKPDSKLASRKVEEDENEAKVAYRAILLARHENESLKRTMIGLRGYVPLSKSEKEIIPSLILQGEIGRYGDNDFAFDTNVMLGPSIKTGAAFIGIFAGVGGSGAGNGLPVGIHIPIEIALTIDNDEYEGDVWLRSRKLFKDSRRDGADNGPLDELSIGFGIQVFPAKAHGLMLGVLYEELQEQTSATIWIGTRLTKPGGGW